MSTSAPSPARAGHAGAAARSARPRTFAKSARTDRDRRHLAAEARVLTLVRHPHLARVVRLRADNGALVERRVPGATLEEFLRSTARPALAPEGHVLVVGQVAAALACLHELGYVHGDVKPSNVIVSRRQGKLHAVVVDLGAATLAGHPRREGTPGFTAPELLDGGVQTPSSDLYALGRLLQRLPPHTLLLAWMERLLAPNPAHRPTARELVLAIARELPAPALLTTLFKTSATCSLTTVEGHSTRADRLAEVRGLPGDDVQQVAIHLEACRTTILGRRVRRRDARAPLPASADGAVLHLRPLDRSGLREFLARAGLDGPFVEEWCTALYRESSCRPGDVRAILHGCLHRRDLDPSCLGGIHRPPPPVLPPPRATVRRLRRALARTHLSPGARRVLAVLCLLEVNTWPSQSSAGQVLAKVGQATRSEVAEALAFLRKAGCAPRWRGNHATQPSCDAASGNIRPPLDDVVRGLLRVDLGARVLRRAARRLAAALRRHCASAGEMSTIKTARALATWWARAEVHARLHAGWPGRAARVLPVAVDATLRRAVSGIEPSTGEIGAGSAAVVAGCSATCSSPATDALTQPEATSDELGWLLRWLRRQVTVAGSQPQVMAAQQLRVATVLGRTEEVAHLLDSLPRPVFTTRDPELDDLDAECLASAGGSGLAPSESGGAWTPCGDPRSCRVSLEAARSFLGQGRAKEAEHRLRSMVPCPRHIAQHAQLLARALVARGQLGTAVGALEEALATTAPGDQRSIVCATLVTLLVNRGLVAEARAILSRTRDDPAPRSARTAALLHAARARLQRETGSVSTSLSTFESALGAALTTGEPGLISTIAMAGGIAAKRVSERGLARHWYGIALARLQSTSDRRTLARVRLNLAALERDAGNLGEAAAQCAAVLAEDRDGVVLGKAWLIRGDVEMHQGDPASAESSAARAADLFATHDHLEGSVGVACLRGELALQAGDSARAQPFAELARRTAARTEDSRAIEDAAFLELRVAMLADDREKVDWLLAERENVPARTADERYRWDLAVAAYALERSRRLRNTRSSGLPDRGRELARAARSLRQAACARGPAPPRHLAREEIRLRALHRVLARHGAERGSRPRQQTGTCALDAHATPEERQPMVNPAPLEPTPPELIPVRRPPAHSPEARRPPEDRLPNVRRFAEHRPAVGDPRDACRPAGALDAPVRASPTSLAGTVLQHLIGEARHTGRSRTILVLRCTATRATRTSIRSSLSEAKVLTRGAGTWVLLTSEAAALPPAANHEDATTSRQELAVREALLIPFDGSALGVNFLLERLRDLPDLSIGLATLPRDGDEPGQAIAAARARLARLPSEKAPGAQVPADLLAGQATSMPASHRDVILMLVRRLSVSGASLSRCLDLILELLLQACEARRGAIVLEARDPSTGRLRERFVVAGARREDAGSRRAGRLVQPVELDELSRSILDRALQRGESFLIQDASEDPWLRDRPSVQAMHLHSVLCVPLAAGGQVFGSLYLDHDDRSAAFSREHLQLLEAAGESSAGILRRVLDAELATRDLARLRRPDSADRTPADMAPESPDGALDSRENAPLRQAPGGKERPAESTECRAAEPPLHDGAVDRLLGRSEAMREVRSRIRRFAAAEVPVVVTGESGTGKELVSEALHALSPRAGAPLIRLNCAALPESIVESELFGYVAGAFSGAERERAGLFEAADGGTLFLDEIGEMSLTIQAKLLRVLETGTVRRLGESRERPIDVRLIAATHQDLDRLVAEGRFRLDLLYRLRVVDLPMPSLRERREDIPLLVANFLPASTRIEPAALSLLAGHDWPGNVRELRAEITRAELFAEDTIGVEHLSPRLREQPRRAPPSPSAAGQPPGLLDTYGCDLREARTAFERELLTEAMERSDGVISRAAKLLSMDRGQMSRLVKRHGLRRNRKGTNRHPEQDEHDRH